MLCFLQFSEQPNGLLPYLCVVDFGDAGKEGTWSGYLVGGEEMAYRRGSEQQPPRRIMRTQTAGNLGEAMMDSEVVPSSLVEIAPILRVANEVESSNPRVAYLCKFHLIQQLMICCFFPDSTCLIFVLSFRIKLLCCDFIFWKLLFCFLQCFLQLLHILISSLSHFFFLFNHHRSLIISQIRAVFFAL